MERKHVSIVTILLAVAALSVGAMAQDRGSMDRGSNDRDQTNPTNPSRTTPSSLTTNASLVRADDLLGADVVDPQGDKVGKVDDLLLDAQGNSVTHLVVARGGFLGMGVKRHAVPWQQLQLDAMSHAGTAAVTGMDDDGRDHDVRISTSKDQFAQSNPPLDNDAWDEYEPDDMGRASRRVSDILGSDVNGRNQDAIGEVEDLVIDADRGRIAYALVDYEGDWSLDADEISVPWPSVSRTSTAINTTLDESTARQLGYRTTDFSRLGEPDNRNRLYGATGSRGYWDDDNLAGGNTSWDREKGTAHDDLAHSGSVGRSGSDTRYGSATDDSVRDRSGSTSGRSGSDTRYGSTTSDAMSGEQVTVTGTIESIMPAGTASQTPGRTDGTVTPGSGRPEGRSGDAIHSTAGNDVLTFRLKQDAGTTMTVDAGSKAALDRQNCNLKQGDRVTVTGHRLAAGTGATGTTNNSGNTGTTGATGEVIMARTIEKDDMTVQVERPNTSGQPQMQNQKR